MIYILILIISGFSSLVGAICGIGGGIIIKPVLDFLGIMSVAEASFLSCCTVLSMAAYSVVKSKASNKSNINLRTSTALALGAVIGGILGKAIFQNIWNNLQNKNSVGAIQAICLIVITITTLIYTINTRRIHTHAVRNVFVTALLGLALGAISSFLGIGGGPINLVVLFYFFSMEIKEAAENSLYIIMFSQIASLINTALSNMVPKLNPLLIVIMIGGGIAGAILGIKINSKISAVAVGKMFIGLMSVIILINTYNLFRFLHV